MTFEVVFVGDTDLPEGQDWVIVRTPRAFYAFIKATRVVPAALTAAWCAFMEYATLRALVAV